MEKTDVFSLAVITKRLIRFFHVKKITSKIMMADRKILINLDSIL
jgi:hypothetical protein